MGSATPPKRMTRSRAAAASAAAATLAPQVTTSDRVSKSTKAPKATKATAASAKKPATAKKTAAAAKKSTVVKKTVTAKKSTITKTTAKTKATTASTSSSVPTSTSAATSTSTSTSVSTSTSTSASTSTATAPPATRKRKLRTHDHNDDDEDDLSKDDDAQPIMNRPAKKLRGPVKKTVDPESESETESVPRSNLQPKPKGAGAQSTATIPVTRSTRGRPKKSTATTATASTVDPQTSSTTSRTRARKATAKDDDVSTTSKQPVAKATRGRKAAGTVTNACTTEPTPGLKSAVSRPASKPSGMLKKTVTFEEPEKENTSHRIVTQAKTETAGTSATGMRAKPVRKPAASGRTTRASARAATTEMTEKKPLSPKKDGQNLPLSRDPGSDDELATYEKTPLKPLMKSPVKPATGVKKLELPSLEKEKDENSPPSLEPTHASVLSSPARRPPPSPFKDTMKSPAKRVDSIPSLTLSSTSTEAQTSQSPSKSTMLQSPAKRPHMPLPAFPLSQDQVGAVRSPTKLSLLHTPAKRPSSPKKLLSSPALQMRDEPKEVSKEVERTPMQEISEDELQSQIRAENCAISPPDLTLMAKALTPITEVDNEESINFESPIAFPGRLSAVLPRHADPALKQNPLPALERSVSMSQFDSPDPQKSEAMVMSEPSKDELNVASPEEDGSNLCKATIEEQHNDLGDAESNEASTSPPETETTNPSKEEFTIKASEQPVVACEVKTQEQDMDIGATNSVDQSAEPMDVGESSTEEQVVSNAGQAAQPHATPKQAKTRGGDDMSDSEDELAFSNKAITKHKGGNQIPKTPATPLPPILKGPILKLPESAARAANKAIRSVSKGPGHGYSVQFGAWRASSPLKARQAQQKPGTQSEDDEDEYSLVEDDHPPAAETPAPKGFFDDEMRILDDMEETQAAIEAALEADIEAKFAKHDFNDLGLMDDLSMISEGDEMSLIDNQESDQSRLDDTPVPAANQENGNQNSIPIDPTLTSNSANAQASSYAPVTPKRTFSAREVHTVSKVPLKRADDSPPRNVKRLCSTASKAAIERPRDTFNNMSLPGQHSSQTELGGQTEESKLALATPSKPASWSSVGTPARTTRPDLDPTVLRGAIVFVDVHTTEGADAGRIFVDLLVQMGARCVKSWPWNPISSAGGEPDVSKVGITHVVFKDGGKRTLEKVVESKGAVQCVGVSWVLDCEKENRWLDEKDYRVDTSLVPRGGQNRRKSMEPKAIANMNGTLVTPMKVNPGPSREPQTVPNNYMSRRDSTMWTRSPSEHDEEDEDAPSEPSEMDWESTNALILTPVPQTPAPEMVARFAMNISPSTPTTSSFNPSAGHNQLLMQTCPPKPSGFVNLSQNFVNSYQDPVQVRLMAARRKSMQFAPEVSSPLKKQWKPTDY